MLRGAVARRYAQALYEIAVANNGLDALEAELKAVNAVIEGEQGLQKILFHPQITTAEKKQVVSQLFEGRVSETTINFLYLIVDRHREAYLSDIVEEFINQANEARNRVDAEVISAKELTAEQKKSLAGVLNRLAGKEVSPEYKVDASLIGGLVVRIGDKVIDGSVKHKLESLKQSLMSKTS
ncbi:F-type H+-transporting ATPase subunit delta [Desulfohalotomaculum tongense]|uniref:F0F1 ATP synthase subunit delta n=1 Tax=Desulforadius tongensis TaxID=1216062 RepID=UPI00195C3FC9|nr:F0F1 ATP synthase subunit delta [Desulforadius tongensis]MBM7853733.1 F-type H+-transporting ATPase subunit delta [Desulforadius tongensis]